ncbi:hypothetical protein [Curtobacterium sp. SORGH_AS_0776]|uniref:tautomerase family protein n=1 Tax=Curtobacterium sp. SORGH_AS_0776 TaxID=3041798 RepID=UPI0028648325|nr:hypothetical protein [Curtobacterium sp. SORGH_AS_0776]MDR6170389.1 phenylpyruvate tautomerase PptA (4-oxalocrotonate tautomerase family) [Curtobacterium sp. SORGH_AS_0776]
MPWINLTMRKGALDQQQQAAAMARLTDALMHWEHVPDTPVARRVMKGWVYEVESGADYVGGSPEHARPSYFVEVRIPAGRLSRLDKSGIMRDFAQILIEAEERVPLPEELRRVWVTIVELEAEDWGIGGHTDWLRAYESALPNPVGQV